MIEVVPGKPSTKAAGQQPPARYVPHQLPSGKQRSRGLQGRLQNQHRHPHRQQRQGPAVRFPHDRAGKILNGIALQGKDLPDYLWCWSRPDLANPGFIATMTFKHTKGENPYRVVLSNLASFVANFMVWDVPAQPAGDSACGPLLG